MYYISTNLIPLESAEKSKQLPAPDPDPASPDDVTDETDAESKSETEGDIS